MAKKLKSEAKLHDGFSMIGISCNLKDYRLCHFINKELILKLERKPDFIYQAVPDAEAQQHSIFYEFNGNYNQEYFLITNKGESGLIFPQHRHVDMFLLIHGDIDPDYLQKVQRAIQKLSNVQLAVGVPMKGIKNIDIILEELELYSIGFKSDS